MTTALADDEILTAIVVPVAARGQGSAYVKFSHPASRYAVIGVAALGDDRRAARARAARVALGGLLPHARAQPAVETGARSASRSTRRGDRGRRGAGIARISATT